MIHNSSSKIIEDFYNKRRILNTYLKQNNISLFTCPSCAYPTLSERNMYEICHICNWEDDGQDDPTANEILGGPNSNISLTESRLQIGHKLKDLAKILNGTINTNPEEILKVLAILNNKLDSFCTENDIMEAHISDPISQEYGQIKENGLSFLISSNK